MTGQMPVHSEMPEHSELPVRGELLVRADGIEISPVEDGYVVFHPGRDRVHHLNPTAAVVLELCTGANTAAGIGAALRALYQPGGSIDSQLGLCLDQLLSEGLIKHTSNGSPHCTQEPGEKAPMQG